MQNGYDSIGSSRLNEFVGAVPVDRSGRVNYALDMVREFEGVTSVKWLQKYRDAAQYLAGEAWELGFASLADTFYSWYVHAVRVLLAS